MNTVNSLESHCLLPTVFSLTKPPPAYKIQAVVKIAPPQKEARFLRGMQTRKR